MSINQDLEIKTPELLKKAPSWDFVKDALKEVERNKRNPDGHNFCVLGSFGEYEDYIQTAQSRLGGWKLERREWYPDGSYTHYFARVASDPKDSTTVQQFQTVIDAFNAFYHNRRWPRGLIWVVLDI